MPTLRIPLVGSYTNRASGATEDQVFTNCFPEVSTNPVTQKSTPKLLKRLGYVKALDFTGVGSASTNGAIVAWSGATTFTITPVAAAFVNNPATTTSVWNLITGSKIGGDIANTAECSVLAETTVSGTANLVGNFYDSSTGVLERWIFPEGGGWTQVTDSDFPAATVVGRPAFMDGFTFDMTSSGSIVQSDLNSVTAYTAGNTISANDYPDKGVTVARLGNYIIGFGEQSIQPFYNAGNAIGSVLSRVQGGTIYMGAGKHSEDHSVKNNHGQTVLPAFGTIYWIGTNSDGAAIGIYRFKGLVPEKVSSVAIDNLVASSTLISFAGTLFMHGQRHVVLNGPAGTPTWAFCIDTNSWWKLVLQAGVVYGCIAVNNLQLRPSAASYFVTSNNDSTNNFTDHQDDGTNFTQTVITENMDLGTQRRKFYRKLRADYDIQSSTSNLGVSWSDDGGATFTTARNIDMASVGSGLTALGSSRRRIWKFTNTANTPCGIKAIEIDYDVAVT